MTCYWEQSAWSKKLLGGDVLWHTSRMKSPVLSPARSALLPGSTLSRYCRAGNSAEGRKSSSTAVAWVCAVKQIQKYKSCNFNSSDTALIPTHFLNNERNICSKFLSSILHVFERQGFSVHSIFGKWSELMTLGLQRWLQEKKIKKYNIYINPFKCNGEGEQIPSTAFELWPCCCSCFFLLDPLPSLGLDPTA